MKLSGGPVSPRQAELFSSYYGFLREWNERMSLVSPKSLENAFSVHFADSLHIADFGFRHRSGLPVFDLGSGAGFPGLVFAIRHPEIPITLYERNLKKQSFLSFAAVQLQLPKVSVVAEPPAGRLRGLYFARAVLPPDELIKYFDKRFSHGRVVVNLGGSKELPPLPKRAKLIAQEKYELPDEAGPRQSFTLSFS